MCEEAQMWDMAGMFQQNTVVQLGPDLSTNKE